jgi:hypothetical protein
LAAVRALAFILILGFATAAAAQQRSPFFSERQHPERVPGSEGRDIPEDSHAPAGTFLAIHGLAALPLGSLDTPEGAIGSSDVFSAGPGVAGDMAVPLTRELGIGASVLWWVSYGLDEGLLTALSLHATGRAQLRRDPFRAWIELGAGGTFNRSDVQWGRIRGGNEEANVSGIVVAGVALEAIRDFWIELTARYHRAFTGPAEDDDVWDASDPQWLLVTLGVGVQT